MLTWFLNPRIFEIFDNIGRHSIIPMTRVRIVFHFSHATVIDNKRQPEVTASNVRNFRERNATRRISWYDEKKAYEHLKSKQKLFLVHGQVAAFGQAVLHSVKHLLHDYKYFYVIASKAAIFQSRSRDVITSGRDKIDFYSRGSLTPRAAMKFRFQSHRHSASAGAPQGLFKFQPKHLYICMKTIKLRNH